MITSILIALMLENYIKKYTLKLIRVYLVE